MKEFVADTGGRYTYADDILNLQELALSMSEIFTGCLNFIISGCEIIADNNSITPGYVWLNKKVRYFEGSNSVSFPYYIYENNNVDSVIYANDVNKKGRYNYLCCGGTSIPDTPDSITGMVPEFIELRQNYAPRFIDKFMGRYAVLLDSPFSKQTIKKDLVLSGSMSADQILESKTAVSVVNPKNGYSLKNIVKANGNSSIGMYLNGLLVNEFIIQTDGTFCLMKQGKELARIEETGVILKNSFSQSAKIGSLLISGCSLINADDETDEGEINFNAPPAKGLYRNFNIYDGCKNKLPLFQVNGKESSVQVNSLFKVRNEGNGIILASGSYSKADTALLNSILFSDKNNERIASMGFELSDTFDFGLSNYIGNITLSPKDSVDIKGHLKINGIDLNDIYVIQKDYITELAQKVNKEKNKGLSTEDFTTAYKEKLKAISTGDAESEGEGYINSTTLVNALSKKLTASDNLSDLDDVSKARINLNVYSTVESNAIFLKINGKLLELVSLSAEEINGLTADEAAKLKEDKQAAIRSNLDAEKQGTGAFKLAKTANLSDLADKQAARTNLQVYSSEEVSKLLAGKLNADAAYDGVVFTDELYQKLLHIKYGNFAYIDGNDVSHAEVDGLVTVEQVKKELGKKAERLMTGYNKDEKNSVASNLNVYNKEECDGKYSSVNELFEDYITYLVKQGKTTAQAQSLLREKLSLLSKDEIGNTYLRKDGRLSDLNLPNADAKKAVCRTIGAAYADEYQTRVADTGWIQMANSGSGTDTRNLFVRQIGSIVSIQGVVNTGKRDGGNRGGVVAVLPNQISAPRYGLKISLCDYDSGVKYNRGCVFVLAGNSRRITISESGWYNVSTELCFTYMV